MSVELAPSSQLGFHRPLTQLVKRTLTVANNHGQPVAFKVKTTAPKQYCVRPNSGRIEPGERVEVQVLLQPMKEEPPAGTRCRDKFLVQSAIITPDRETRTLQELWATIETEAKAGKEGLIHEQKIRCAYLPPVDESSTEHADRGTLAATNASAFTNGTPSRYDSFRPSSGNIDLASFDSSNKGFNGTLEGSETGVNGASNAHAAPRNAAPGSTTKSVTTNNIKTAATTPPSTMTGAAQNTAASVGLAKDLSQSSAATSADPTKLQLQLQQARAEIEMLRDILAVKEKEASSGLRQRKIPGVPGEESSANTPGALTAVVTQDGISLPVVGALVAATFLFTLLFF